MDLDLGKIIEGKVIKITAFGAFIELDKGISGLVHISEIADTYIEDINQFIQTNDTVMVKIISVEPSGKIGLSIKQAQQQQDLVPPIVMDIEEKNDDRFEDKLAKFMKDSNEKQQSLKKHLETKKSR